MRLEHCREDNTMENDIVLSDEMDQSCLLILPPLLPASQLRTSITKFLGIADVTNGSIKPNIKNLTVRTFYRHRNTPIKVTRHSTRTKSAIEPTLALSVNIAAPFLVILKYPLLKPLLVLVQRQIPMLRRLLDKRITCLCIIGINQFLGRKSGTTLLALITISLGSMAARTLTTNVAVCKEMTSLFVKELLTNLLHKLAFVIKLTEKVARQLVVRIARGTAINVERNTKTLETVLNKIMIAVNHLLNRYAFLAGTNGYGHTMLIATTDEQTFASLQTKVARIDISGHINTCQMTNMYRSVCIRQSRCNGCSLELFSHVRDSVYFSAQKYNFFCI